MAKYIVDLPDAYTSKSALLGDILSIPIILEGGKCYGIPTGIKLESCTEPDEDEIRQKVENEVWELHKNIMYDTKYKGGLEPTYQEAKAKYDSWKKEKDEIHVGDEVIPLDIYCKPMVVTHVRKGDCGDIWLCTIRNDGSTYEFMKTSVKKTGRHFDEVEKLLERMRGE